MDRSFYRNSFCNSGSLSFYTPLHSKHTYIEGATVERQRLSTRGLLPMQIIVCPSLGFSQKDERRYCSPFDYLEYDSILSFFCQSPKKKTSPFFGGLRQKSLDFGRLSVPRSYFPHTRACYSTPSQALLYRTMPSIGATFFYYHTMPAPKFKWERIKFLLLHLYCNHLIPTFWSLCIDH